MSTLQARLEHTRVEPHIGLRYNGGLLVLLECFTPKHFYNKTEIFAVILPKVCNIEYILAYL
jgi:hypothetical protein